jgi:hypothetical protein
LKGFVDKYFECKFYALIYESVTKGSCEKCNNRPSGRNPTSTLTFVYIHERAVIELHLDFVA